MISSASSSKVLLVAGRRVAATEGSPVRRRFRLARLRLDGRPAPGARASLDDRR